MHTKRPLVMTPTTYSTAQRLGVLAVSAIAISYLLTYTYVPPPPPAQNKEEKPLVLPTNKPVKEKKEVVIAPVVVSEEPTAASVDEILVTSSAFVDNEALANAIVDEAIAAVVNELVGNIAQEEEHPLVADEAIAAAVNELVGNSAQEEEHPLVADEAIAAVVNELVENIAQEEEHPLVVEETTQEAFTKTFELSNGNGEQDKEQVDVDFVLLRLDSSYFVWVGVGGASLGSITVAMPGGATSGVWGNTNNPQDLASAARLAKKTKQVVHFSSSLPAALEDQHPELRMLCEREIVRNILNT